MSLVNFKIVSAANLASQQYSQGSLYFVPSGSLSFKLYGDLQGDRRILEGDTSGFETRLSTLENTVSGLVNGDNLGYGGQ